MPGFRPGKVPRKVLEARMGGAGALRAEALRESLPDFYARAVTDTELDPIAQPEIDITGGEDGGAVLFDAVVQVRPIVAIPGYDGLHVTLPGPRRQRRGESRASSTACARTTPSSKWWTARPSTATASPSTCTATTPRAPRWSASTTTSTRWVRPRRPRARRRAARGQGRRHPRLRHGQPGRPDEKRGVPRAGQRRQDQEAARGHRRMGRRELRVRHGGRAARGHRRRASVASS